MMRLRLSPLLPLSLALLGGCSDPTLKPIPSDPETCKNLVKYSLSGDTHLTGASARRADHRHRAIRSGHREMTREYDGEGRVVRTTYDGWGSKQSLLETRFFYDAHGRRERTETDEDGTPSTRAKHVYTDADPFVVEVQYLDPADGVLMYGYRYELAKKRWLLRYEHFDLELIRATDVYRRSRRTTKL